MMFRKISAVFAAVLSAGMALPAVGLAQALPKPDEIKSIAEEALIYGLPMVMGYGVMYQFAIDEKSGNYKAPFNKIYNEAHTFTPADTGVVTPNSDTPYSFVWMDLRAEPIVLCVPEIEKDRYFSVMLTSMYTYNFGYLGSRTTGNGGGCYAVAGPNWAGDTPKGIDKVITSGSEFAFAVYRTQLFNAADIDNVRAIQAKYTVEPLSAFLGGPAPSPAPEIDWPTFRKFSTFLGEPISTAATDWTEFDKAIQEMNPFSYLAFMLQFCPPTGPAAVEVPLRERLASIGIEAGKPFSTDGWSEEAKTAFADGIRAGVTKVEEHVKTFGEKVNGWQISKGLFGSREMLGDDYLIRAVAAVAGIYGNDSAEALYPATKEDADGVPGHGYETVGCDATRPFCAPW